MSEQENKKPVPEGLNPEEIKVLQEINDILDVYMFFQESLSYEEMNKVTIKKQVFQKELTEKGINLENYLLWNRLVGSTRFDKLKFDITEKDVEDKEWAIKMWKVNELGEIKGGLIENFARELYAEYKK